MLTYSMIQGFPKVELHCHLDGSIRPKTLQRIAQVQGLAISDDIKEVTYHMQAPKNCENLVDYLATFDYVLPYLQTEIGLEMAAYDVMEQAFLDGVRYIEIRFSPTLSMRQGLTVKQTIDAVAKGIALAEQTYPVIGNILVIGMRNDPHSLTRQAWSDTLPLEHDKVVGFDLAGPEEDGYLDEFGGLVTWLVDTHQVNVTLHAGECGCLRNVLDAIDVGATRIGHGIALMGHKEDQDKVRDSGICIEGCPTSNVQTRMLSHYEDYPLQEWLRNDVPFCINTDNRTVSNTTLTNEYFQMVQGCGLTAEQFRQMNQVGMTHAYATDKLKEMIVVEMEQACLE